MHELYDAIKAGDRDAVGRLLNADLTLLQARNEAGVSAISLAMYFGKPEVANLFVERGALLDIFEASALGATERVKELLDKVNDFSTDGFTPVQLAAYFGHPGLVRLLADAGADVNAQSMNAQRITPMHAAASRGCEETVRILLERCADPDARQNLGYTALHTATANGNKQIVDLLLAHGADPAPVADDGKTPADLAPRANAQTN